MFKTRARTAPRPRPLSLALAGATPAKAEKLTVMLDWFINPDHGPLIVALEKGFFAEAGLEVELIEPADPNDPPKLVAAGKAPVAVSYQPQLHIQAAQDLPLTRIGTLVATPLNTLLVLDESPVKTIADLKGRKVGFSVGGFEDAVLMAMLAPGRAYARGRHPDQRQLLPQPGAAVRPGRRRDRRLPQLRAQPARHRGPQGPRLLRRGARRAALRRADHRRQPRAARRPAPEAFPAARSSGACSSS